jgi:DNA polymerase-3 subunit chi
MHAGSPSPVTMTTIDFYTGCADPFDVASRLVTKAWARHGSVRVLTGDEAGTVEFGRFLWLWPATGFLPHCRLSSPLATETPIVVDHVLEHEGPAAVLINLHRMPPPFFSRFERMAEIVGAAEAEIAAGRERWKFYKARGYEVRSHDLSARA